MRNPGLVGRARRHRLVLGCWRVATVRLSSPFPNCDGNGVAGGRSQLVRRQRRGARLGRSFLRS